MIKSSIILLKYINCANFTLRDREHNYAMTDITLPLFTCDVLLGHDIPRVKLGKNQKNEVSFFCTVPTDQNLYEILAEKITDQERDFIMTPIKTKIFKS